MVISFVKQNSLLNIEARKHNTIHIKTGRGSVLVKSEFLMRILTYYIKQSMLVFLIAICHLPYYVLDIKVNSKAIQFKLTQSEWILAVK